jgi:hypothetical protein
MFDAVKLLEDAGIDKFEINYRTKVVSGLSKEDLLKLMALSDDGSVIPVAFARDGWKFTTDRINEAVP